MKTMLAPNVTEKNAASKRRCFAHHFLTFEEYGLWTHAREVSAESRVFYFDGRAVAARFCDQGKDTVYRIAAGLARKGFFHVLKKSKREKKTGLFKPTQYQPLSFEEWKEKHPARYAACKVCKPSLNSGMEPVLNSRLEPVLKTGLEEPSPVWNSRTTSLENENDLSGIPDIILIKNIMQKEKESKTPRAQGARTAAPVGLATQQTPLRVSEKIVAALTASGDRGMRTAELAAHVYGDDGYRARDRVVQLIAALRRKGFTVLLVGNDNFARRYVLQKN